VQQSSWVASTVDSFIQNDMNYNTWKAFAQSKNLYAKPGSGGFVNANNTPLYYKNDSNNPNDHALLAVPNGQQIPTNYARFTSLKQITMSGLVPGDHVTMDIPDRILFIDTAEGTPNGTPTNISLGSNDDWFWKGLVYINGSLSMQGAGASPTINVKNPTQYAQYLADPVANRTNGYNVASCVCDGILYATGEISRGGNQSVYGTVATKTGMGSGGGPVIYYNSRNKFGLFKDKITTPNNELAGLISGPICEIVN
jgi:hypothetical protein